MGHSHDHYFTHSTHGHWQHNGRHFPPFALFGGLFVLFILIKTGLFVPLLLIGGLFCFMGMKHWHGMKHHQFHPFHEGHGHHDWKERHAQEKSKRKNDDSGYI